MRDVLSVGDVQELEFIVPPEKTVPHLYPESEDFQQMPEVFATGYLVGLVEWCCLVALRPVIEETEDSLGTMVDIRHTAPTPPGARLTVTATCTFIGGTYIEWDVEVRDDDGDIAGSGKHGRNIVDTGRFLKHVARKAERLAQAEAARAGE